MKQAVLWFFLSCKRCLRRGAFLAVLFFFPAAAMAFSLGEKGEDEGIRVAVWAEDEEGLGQELAEKLTEPSEAGMFRFYLCGSEDEVEDEVASRRAECGYVIGEGLEDKLDRKEFKRSIRVYQAPSTVTAELSGEIVFASLAELYHKTLLERYAAEGEAFAALDEAERREAAQRAGELYEEILAEGRTFHFEYAETGGKEEAAEPEDTKAVFPVRGVGAVLVFAAGLYGGVMLGEDEKKGLFGPLKYSLRLPCRLALLGAPTALAGCSVLGALGAGGAWEGVWKELGCMAGYVILTAAFSWCLKMVCKSSQALCCLIPFFLIGSLVFCPVFVDIGSVFREIEWIGRLFVPYYYLKLF